MKIGVSVHMGTLQRLWASGGGKICITDTKCGSKKEKNIKMGTKSIIKVQFLADPPLK